VPRPARTFRIARVVSRTNGGTSSRRTLANHSPSAGRTLGTFANAFSITNRTHVLRAIPISRARASIRANVDTGTFARNRTDRSPGLIPGFPSGRPVRFVNAPLVL